MSEPITDKRCGTCRYHVPKFPFTARSHYRYCDWLTKHLVDDKTPYWVHKDRPLTHIAYADCGAWERKP